jgi:hypothetical protein
MSLPFLRFIYSPPSTQDYETANDPTLSILNESERAGLYSELASGAETGQALCWPSFRCLTAFFPRLGLQHSFRFTTRGWWD